MYLDHTYMFVYCASSYIYMYMQFHSHALIVLCKVSIVEAIKYQNKDANRFAVLPVL